MEADKFTALLKRLEAVTAKLETMPPSGGAAAAAAPPVGAASAAEDESVSPMVKAFDDLLAGAVAEYVRLANKISMPEVGCRPPSPRGSQLLVAMLRPRRVCVRLDTAGSQAGGAGEADL